MKIADLTEIYTLHRSVLRRVHSLFQRVQSSASSFNFHYRPVSLRSSSSCLRLFLPVPVTSNLPYIFHSTECFRRRFLREMWPIQLAFLLFIVCSMPLSSLTLCNTSSSLTWSIQLISSTLLQHHTSKLSGYFQSAFQTVQFSARYRAGPPDLARY
jgi:hypothetical protein